MIGKRFAAACCAVVLVISFGQASGSSAATEQRTLLVLGDSLTWGTAYKGFGNVVPQLQALGTFEKVIVDGVHARNISGPARTSRNGVKTYKEYIKKGMVPDAVIVALGSNDLQQSPKASFYLREIRELLKLIGPRPVVWVNVYRSDSPSYPKRSATFTKVMDRMPSGSSLDVIFTRRSPSGKRYLCNALSMTFNFSGQLPCTRAR